MPKARRTHKNDEHTRFFLFSFFFSVWVNIVSHFNSRIKVDDSFDIPIRCTSSFFCSLRHFSLVIVVCQAVISIPVICSSDRCDVMWCDGVRATMTMTMTMMPLFYWFNCCHCSLSLLFFSSIEFSFEWMFQCCHFMFYYR